MERQQGRNGMGSVSPRAPLGPVPNNRCCDFDSSVPSSQSQPLPPHSSSSNSTETVGSARSGELQGKETTTSTDGGSSLFLVGDEEVDERDLGHRIAFLRWRGFDENLLQIMHDSVYDDDDESDPDARRKRCGIDGGHNDEGGSSSSSGSGECYVPCEAMDNDALAAPVAVAVVGADATTAVS